MKHTTIIKAYIFLFFISCCPLFALADTGQPGYRACVKEALHIQMMQDTLPPAVKTKEKTAKAPPVETIKVIPTARKQPIPVPVKVKIKPVKVVTPKIIKPVIKLLP